MKCLMTIVLLTICNVGQAQKTDTTLAIPQLSFDTNGELKITASATSSQSDFDFLVGKWKMHNRRLNKRLEDCKDWTEFDHPMKISRYWVARQTWTLIPLLRCLAR